MKRLKAYAFRLTLAVLLTGILGSCGVKRFFYLNGLNIWHSGKRAATTNEELSKSSAITLNTTTRSEDLFKERVDIQLIKNLPPKKKDAVIPHPEKKKIVPKITGLRTKIIAPDKNASKKKISVSQINILAFISFLMVPLFIVSLFIQIPALIFSSLIIGVGLAVLCGFLADGRKGCWMVGIAIGFWIILMAYLALIILFF